MGARRKLGTRRTKQGVVLIMVLVLAAGVSSGCSNLASRVTQEYNSSTNAFAEPGLYEHPNGTTQAVGRLAFRNTAAGSWAVVDTALPQQVDTAPVVAVIVPDSQLASKMESYRDKYVSVTGTKVDNSNAAQTVPVIQATSIDLFRERVAE